MKRVSAASLVIAAMVKKKYVRKPKQNVRCAWVKPWLKRRAELGVYDILLKDFRKKIKSNTNSFYALVRNYLTNL